MISFKLLDNKIGKKRVMLDSISLPVESNGHKMQDRRGTKHNITGDVDKTKFASKHPMSN